MNDYFNAYLRFSNRNIFKCQMFFLFSKWDKKISDSQTSAPMAGFSNVLIEDGFQ